MKNIKIFIATILLLVTATTVQAQITKAELTATGLTCSMCSKATYKQLASIPEVEKVETDLNKTAFILYFKEGSTINVNSLKKKVEDAGFSVGQLIVTMKLNNQKAENNASFTQDNISYTFMNSTPKLLSGEVKVKILDKGFVTEKEYKQLVKLAKQYPTYTVATANTYHIKTM